ncbi:MAG: TonB-dependent receptor [Sphingopyxis sp.]|nr:TonB-dependent receptor [Sphingopyxis sp.]
MTTVTLRRLATGASLAALALATPAFAQVEEIIVTANKVAENVQDVPIAVTAVSGDALEAAGTTSLENIGDLVPSVTFRKGTTSANSAIFLRGVGTITFSIAAEPSVSTVVDGIVLSRSGQAFSDLVEVDRIEVLRGPQGTLFGKNASAGLVSIISKGGSDTFEGDLNVGVFEDSEYRARLSIAGPLAENLTARVTGFYGSFDGHIRNIFTVEDVNGYEHFGVRAIIDWEGEGAKLRLIADGFRADDDCCAEITGVSRGAVLDAELGLPGGVAQGDDQRAVNHNLTTRTQDRQWSLTAQGDFDIFAGHTLTVIGGYRNWRNIEFREGDFLPRAVVGTAELHDQGAVETDQYSIEARLASDQALPFRYQVGAFYWASDNSQIFRRDDISCASSTLPVRPSGATPCNLNDTVNTLFPTAISFSDVEARNFALFGQLTYDITERLSVTAGLRWTNDELDFVHTRAPGFDRRTGAPATGPGISGSGAGGSIASGGNGTNTSTGSSSNDNFSGKAVVQYEVTDDINTYVSYTRGYKGPAFNVFFNHTAPNNAVPIDEETSDAYELGIKSRFADNRIQLNLALFRADYQGFQANNFVLLNGAVITNLTNAGTVRTEGFELDGLFNAADGLDFNASVAYADATVRQFNPNPLTNAPSAINGTRLPLAPEWSYTVGANYESSLERLGIGAFVYANTSYNFTDDQFSDLGNAGPIDSYGIWNASLGFSDTDDKYRLTFHVRNITDKSYVLLNTSAGQRLHIPRDADRYAGVTLRVGFGGN